MRYWIFLIFLFSCNTSGNEPTGADNALDAGRNYLQACSEGDFIKASRYCAQDSAVVQNLRKEEIAFRLLDREGRQLHRTASIQVYDLEETDQGTARLIFGLSYDPQKKDTLWMEKKNNRWFIVSSQSKQ
jgi:hypothetical protein